MTPPNARTEMPYQMPHERRSNQRVGHRRERQPDDDNDLELLEIGELGDHADGDGRAESSA